MNVKVEINAEDKATEVIEKFRSSLDGHFGQVIGRADDLSNSLDDVSGSLKRIGESADGVSGVTAGMKALAGETSIAAEKFQGLLGHLKTLKDLFNDRLMGGAGVTGGIAAAVGAAAIYGYRKEKERYDELFAEGGKADPAAAARAAVYDAVNERQRIFDEKMAARDAAAKERDRRQTLTENALDAPRRAFEEANSGKGKNELEMERILRNLPSDALITREQRIDAMNEARARDKSAADAIAKMEEEKKLKEQNLDLERRAQEIVDQSMTKRQKEIRDRKEINELLSAGKLTQEQAEAALNAVGLRYADPVKAAAGPIRSTTMQLGDNMMESRFLTGRAPKADEQLSVLKSLERIARENQEEQRRERAKVRRDPNKVLFPITVGQY